MSLVADLITVTGYCVACHRRTSCAKYSGAGCSGAGGPSVHWILHIVARFTRHRSTDTLCLTASKPLHTAEPLCFSELICHYLPSRSLHSSNTFLLARPSVWSLLATFRRHGPFCFFLELCTHSFYWKATSLQTPTKMPSLPVRFCCLVTVSAPQLRFYIICLCAYAWLGGDRARRRVSVVVDWTRHSDDGALSALVSFRLHQTKTTTSTSTTTTTASSSVGGGGGGTGVVVTLYWRTSTCNARPGFAYCDLPNSDNSRTYYALYNQARSLSDSNNWPQ